MISIKRGGTRIFRLCFIYLSDFNAFQPIKVELGQLVADPEQLQFKNWLQARGQAAYRAYQG